MTYAADTVFLQIQQGVKTNVDLAKKINSVYLFNITNGNDSKSWTIDLKANPPSVYEGKPSKADVTITISDSDYMGLVDGKVNGQQLFMGGKLKLAGNMALAMKLDQLTKGLRATETAAAPKATASASGFKSDVFFPQIDAKVKADPGLAKRVNGVFCFNITGGPGGAQKTWTVDVKNTPGKVAEGKPDKADVTITISDDDYVSLVTGKSNPQQLFMSGKLRMAGNMALAMKLEQLTKGMAKL
eukprot:TRINITY_DN8728_c0_g1_i1.p1 TRINITY_DN8728_c0_g1~~TRINITY_DN8728_c0_g1_i1.p1  ORF type:complete len:243 (-),score=89.69 TRINITY_DN8728_c0_g1_i1:208-936(-)